MKEQNGCVLLYKARELAKERGLEIAQVACALLAVCDGTRCILLDENKAKINEEWRILRKKLDERK